MNRSKASGVSWVKPAEPSFLKKFKNDVGYKEGPDVDTKRQAMPTLDDDSGSDREDELPQVVVLKGGDLSAEDVKKLKGDMLPGGAEKDDKPPADGKILFKKPAKRSSSDKFQGITASSSKKKKRKSDGGEKKKKKKSEEEEEEEDEEERVEGGEGVDEEKKEVKSGKTVKNNSLLSFGDDEEDED
ncbi:uncharacterized protein KIAA1143 homolog [Cyclopterus lumpus]|uniref:Zgc:77056 n=1 Tax=Cyclopterus lumpus TaxID=8103 RepID=A0A8C2X4Y9_CYCLU|nr:uncharacterized protein KIAA1143 homolog [Cyclopterus lumpus]